MSFHDLRVRDGKSGYSGLSGYSGQSGFSGYSGIDFDTVAKEPYLRTAGVDVYAEDTLGPARTPPVSYTYNSLEGSLFNGLGGNSGYSGYSGLGISGYSGRVVLPTGSFAPNFNYLAGYSSINAINPITDGKRDANGIVTIYTTGEHGLVKGDIVSIFDTTGGASGYPAGASGEYFGGVYKVTALDGTSGYQYIKKGPARTSIDFPASTRFFKNNVIEAYDNRNPQDPSGKSYTSILLTPKKLDTVNTKKRIVPSDMYTRFKFSNALETEGGLNSAIFSVLDATTGLNIKPAIWAWFFGGITKDIASDFSSADRAPNNNFDIIFNSYSLVLRPSGEGTYLEYALLKFNWGNITSVNWPTDYIDTNLIKHYSNVNGTDVGYLISTNPETATKTSGGVTTAYVTEIAKSNQFLYDDTQELKINLKLSIRKHVLTDAPSDNTYLFQLALNQDYNSFGSEAEYSAIMTSFIRRPSFIVGGNQQYYSTLTSDMTNMANYIFQPWMYFKFINNNPTGYGSSNSSKIVLDSLMYRQMNSADAKYY